MGIAVEILDDFDLEKIRISGQCFRVSRLGEEHFRLVALDKVLTVRDAGGGLFEASCSKAEWDGFWFEYFDLGRSYSKVRRRCRGRNSFVDDAMDYGQGLRILRQDPWEMLITFIVSQRKNMPAIASAVEQICESFGNPIADGVFAFPTPDQLACASEEALRGCSLGYRAPYILNTSRRVANGDIDLSAMAQLDDSALFERLQDANGVGAKVANCVCLFGFGRTSQVPVDVWIARAIEQECEGEEPFSQYGEDAGIMQQYVFFYMTDRKRR